MNDLEGKGNGELIKIIEKLQISIDRATTQNKQNAAASKIVDPTAQAVKKAGGDSDLMKAGTDFASGDIAGAIGNAIAAALNPLIQGIKSQTEKGIDTPEQQGRAYLDQAAKDNMQLSSKDFGQVVKKTLDIGGRRVRAQRYADRVYRQTSWLGVLGNQVGGDAYDAINKKVLDAQNAVAEYRIERGQTSTMSHIGKAKDIMRYGKEGV